MNLHVTTILIAIVTVCHVTSVCAHGVSRVRKELKEQGYEQLEFQRRKPPYKLDACRDGQRYHLHVDFYGKITQKSAAGDCDQESSDAPAPDDDSAVNDSDQASSADKPTNEP